MVIGQSTLAQQLISLTLRQDLDYIAWQNPLTLPNQTCALVLQSCKCLVLEAMSDKNKRKNPPSALELVVSVVQASSNAHVLTCIDSDQWSANVEHMEGMVQVDPDHGHTLMVISLAVNCCCCCELNHLESLIPMC